MSEKGNGGMAATITPEKRLFTETMVNDTALGGETQALEFLGSKMRTAIRMRGMKQIEVCRAVGLLPSRLSNYLSGSREPDLYTLSKIAAVLNQPLEFFSLYHAEANVQLIAEEQADTIKCALAALREHSHYIGEKGTYARVFIDALEELL